MRRPCFFSVLDNFTYTGLVLSSLDSTSLRVSVMPVFTKSLFTFLHSFNNVSVSLNTFYQLSSSNRFMQP